MSDLIRRSESILHLSDYALQELPNDNERPGELPQKKEPTQLPISPLLQKQYTEFEKSYNACIDEILRGCEENG